LALESPGGYQNMTNALTLLNHARRELLSGVVEERNKLSASITAGDTTFALAYPPNSIRPNTVIEVELEQMYVWAVNETASTITVERGWDGSAATTHAANSHIVSRPRFPLSALFDHLNEEIMSLSGTNGMYAMRSLELEHSGLDRSIDLTGAVRLLDVWEVRRKRDDADWPVIHRWRLARLQNQTDFATGNALIFDEDVADCTLRILYRSGFTPLTTTSQLVTDSGLPDTALDIVRMGVQIRAMSMREAKRSFTETQGDTRRSEEVPPGAASSSWRQLAILRQARLVEEATRLATQYPMRLNRWS